MTGQRRERASRWTATRLLTWTSTKCAGLPHLGRPLGQGEAGVCARSMGALGGRPERACARRQPRRLLLAQGASVARACFQPTRIRALLACEAVGLSAYEVSPST